MTVIVVGEIHGTVEVPSLVVQLAQRAIASGRSVKIGIEQSALSVDAVSKCSTRIESKVIACLLTQPIWNRPPALRDGRSSEAIAELLKFVSRIGDASKLGAFGLDPSNYWEAAKVVAAEAVGSSDYIVLLVGNYHSGAFGSNPRGSMTKELRGVLPSWNIVSVAPIFSGGTIWRYDSAGASDAGTIQPAYIGDDTNGVFFFDLASLSTLRARFTVQQWTGIASARFDMIAMMGRSSASPPLTSHSPIIGSNPLPSVTCPPPPDQ